MKFNAFGNFTYLLYVTLYTPDNTVGFKELNPKIDMIYSIEGHKTQSYEIRMPLAEGIDKKLWIVGCFKGKEGV